ncbi:hypothetical protein HOC13_02540 [Candidatus Woesearchaeota archaeon]|jgi:hypothetical protein|nr:hypothetical protein [Candidatus Woesearchaeota archaeon]
MKLSKTQKRILYSLGQCYKKLNQPYQDKPLKVLISKAAFIDLILQADFIKKQHRALYKNLAFLENKKLISYEDKKIKLTERGQLHFDKIERELQPFLNIVDFWHKDIQTERKLQTYITEENTSLKEF